jgi:multicomponent Na+:H+ antiporter subunit D
VERLNGTGDLKRLGGLSRAQPGLAGLFLVSALSLAGLPPLSGFLSKYVLVYAGLSAPQYTIVIVSLAVSLLTLFYVLKIWNEVFWKPAPTASEGRDGQAGALPGGAGAPPRLMMGPIALLTVLSVLMGLGAQFVFVLALRAAEGLLDPTIYIQAVLGPG